MMFAVAGRNSVLGALSRPVLFGSRTVRVPLAQRLYSAKTGEEKKDDAADDAAKKEEGSDAAASTDAKPESEGAEDPTTKQLKEKDARIKELADSLLYCKAELQNVQRRTAEEKKTLGDQAITRLAKDLTESIDVLNLALRSVPEKLRTNSDKDNEPARALVELYDGVSLTRKSILDMLRTHGIEAFDPVGEKFDPLLHEALYQAPVPGKEPGSVLDCSKIGYKIKGRLLRAAQVGVVQDTS